MASQSSEQNRCVSACDNFICISYPTSILRITIHCWRFFFFKKKNTEISSYTCRNATNPCNTSKVQYAIYWLFLKIYIVHHQTSRVHECYCTDKRVAHPTDFALSSLSVWMEGFLIDTQNKTKLMISMHESLTQLIRKFMIANCEDNCN